MTTVENPARAGTFIRQPFAGNRLPASRLDQGLILYAKSTLPSPDRDGSGPTATR